MFAEPPFQSKQIAEKVRVILGHFGSFLGHFGPFWVIFGPLWGIWGHFWPFLGHFVAFLDKFAESSNFLRFRWGQVRMYALFWPPICLSFSLLLLFLFCSTVTSASNLLHFVICFSLIADLCSILLFTLPSFCHTLPREA